MTDYIKREDAREKLCSMCRWEGTENCGECEHPIDDIPAADVREVARGRWVKKDDGICYWHECSECGGRMPLSIYGADYHSHYCPDCGADMRDVK